MKGFTAAVLNFLVPLRFAVRFWKFQALGIMSSFLICNELSNHIQRFFVINMVLDELLILNSKLTNISVRKRRFFRTSPSRLFMLSKEEEKEKKKEKEESEYLIASLAFS